MFVMKHEKCPHLDGQSGFVVDPCSETDDMNRTKQATNRAIGRSENLGGAKINPRPFEEEDFASKFAKYCGRLKC